MIGTYLIAAVMVCIGLVGNYLSGRSNRLGRSILFDVIGYAGVFLAFIAGGAACP